MQVPFSLVPSALAEVEAAISPARLNRYMLAAVQDKHYAMRLYLWNGAICERLYLPLQTAEICVRNGIHRLLTSRYGDWCTNHAFINLLSAKYQAEVQDTTASEKADRGSAYTIDHVVAAMSFGFWTTLLAKRFQHHLWHGGLQQAFPFAPATLDREKAYIKVNRLREFRNKVAHHYAVFDRKPFDHYVNATHIIGWASPAAVEAVDILCNPRETIKKPKR